ncbi:IclR family transcriptional regulator [Nocardiopsis coralli]|nr:helix-turn-helix domain-containing protein [Nocardiopsis coralli]
MAHVTGVGVLDRVMTILDTVEHTPMGASALARHLGLSVPTTHRLVAAMVSHGLLRRDARGLHHPGQRLLSSGIASAAAPVLEELRAQTDESAQLWVRRGDHRLCLLSVESHAELRAALPAGTLLPLTDLGSAARVLSGACGPPERADGGRTWAESISERTPGLGSVSAPVVVQGETVAAVCVSAPLARVHAESIGAQVGGAVVAAAERVERAVLPHLWGGSSA